MWNRSSQGVTVSNDLMQQGGSGSRGSQEELDHGSLPCFYKVALCQKHFLFLFLLLKPCNMIHTENESCVLAINLLVPKVLKWTLSSSVLRLPRSEEIGICYVA